MSGRINKFYGEVTLLKQPFVMDDKKSVEKVVQEAGKAVRELVCYLRAGSVCLLFAVCFCFVG